MKIYFSEFVNPDNNKFHLHNSRSTILYLTEDPPKSWERSERSFYGKLDRHYMKGGGTFLSGKSAVRIRLKPGLPQTVYLISKGTDKGKSHHVVSIKAPPDSVFYDTQTHTVTVISAQPGSEDVIQINIMDKDICDSVLEEIYRADLLKYRCGKGENSDAG